jgi:cholesterol oxidase
MSSHFPYTFDFVIVGSGFGGSVSALRLTEKGYRVLVLERGKRFRDDDFPKTNWTFWKYLWAPALRCFGILQISFFRDVFALHGSGVGGGSLGYAAVLMEPDAQAFAEPAWRQFADWQALLRPHYDTARRMLGVARNPRLSAADYVLKDLAHELGRGETFQATESGIFFGEPGQEGQLIPDPFFGGEGPARRACQHCGGCMIGCRHNAKNTLVKNYLYFAERRGAEIRPECEVRDIRPLLTEQSDGARYEVTYRSATAWWRKPECKVRARNVVVAAGTVGTLRLLWRCHDVTRSLPRLSPRLGERVRSNGEAVLGVTNPQTQTDYSKGIAITSIFRADDITAIEPVHYPAGSDLMRLLAAPLVDTGGVLRSISKALWEWLTHPRDFFSTLLQRDWAKRTTIILVMQIADSRLRLRVGRSLFTLFRRGLVSERDATHPIPTRAPIGRHITREFARRTQGIPLGAFNESLFNIPLTAHLLGGCPFGRNADEGVIDDRAQVHNYPGLYVIDGSIMPANPGVNPSLTIAAMAEYFMGHIPAKTHCAASP